MSIPGFTASTSLSSAGRRYRAAAVRSGASAGASAVLPQLPRQLELLQCLQNCSLAGADDACQVTCFRMHDIRLTDDQFPPPGGGGGDHTNPHCIPKCAPCRLDPESETGRSRTCITFDCDQHTVAC